jgi:hypothetical protein
VDQLCYLTSEIFPVCHTTTDEQNPLKEVWHRATLQASWDLRDGVYDLMYADLGDVATHPNASAELICAYVDCEDGRLVPGIAIGRLVPVISEKVHEARLQVSLIVVDGEDVEWRFLRVTF